MAAANNLETRGMKKLKNLRLIIIVLAVILVLVIIRTSNKNLFKQDPEFAINVATKSINAVSAADLKKLSAQYILVDLDNPDNYNSSQFEHSVNIPFEQLLEKTNRKVLDETKGEIVLFSEDVSTASKAWVILNQLDFQDVLILQTSENIEVFNYKFQPDTTARLE